MLNLEFHHVAVATFNIGKSIAKYNELEYTSSEITNDPIQNVNVCFLNKLGHPCIELVEPVDESSPVYQILKKNGTSPYHFCYKVDDIGKTILELKSLKFILLQKPVKARAFNDNKICFMYNKDIGLIELLE